MDKSVAVAVAAGAASALATIAIYSAVFGGKKRSPEQDAEAVAASVERRIEGAVRNAVLAQTQSIHAALNNSKVYPPIERPAKQKRVLVTGGAGFVGSNLVDALMTQGHIVYVMDNLFTGKRKNIEHCALCRPRALVRRSPRTHPLRSAPLRRPLRRNEPTN